jgi:hypothetical protein
MNMRRICEQIFDDMQQICRIRAKILAKYARICDGYSQYAAVYLRMELVISVILSNHRREAQYLYHSRLPSVGMRPPLYSVTAVERLKLQGFMGFMHLQRPTESKS